MRVEEERAGPPMSVHIKLRSSLWKANDLRLIENGVRSNTLLVGPALETLEALAHIEGSLSPTVVEWPFDGAPWTVDEEPGTVILHDVDALGPDDQMRLLQWLEGPGSRSQVISLSSQPVLPLVLSGRFLDRLYYRLNVLYIEFS